MSKCQNVFFLCVWTVPLKRQNSLASFLWTGLYAIPQKLNVRVPDHCLFDCHHFRLSWSSMFLSWLPKWCRMNEICGRSCARTCWRIKSPIIPSDRLQNEPFGAPSHPPLLILKGENDTEKLLFISRAIIHSPVSQTSWEDHAVCRDEEKWHEHSYLQATLLHRNVSIH